MSALFKWLASKIQKYIEYPDSTGYISAADLEKYALKSELENRFIHTTATLLR